MIAIMASISSCKNGVPFGSAAKTCPIFDEIAISASDRNPIMSDLLINENINL